MNNAQKKKQEDILTYRFYVELCIMAVIAVGLTMFSNMLQTLKGISRFPDVMSIIFIFFCVLFVGAIAYKVFSDITGKAKLSVFSANFVLAWAIALFIGSAGIFVQTLDYKLMKYDETITAYTVLLIAYAVLCITNFFLGGDLFAKLFKKALKKQEK